MQSRTASVRKGSAFWAVAPGAQRPVEVGGRSPPSEGVGGLVGSAWAVATTMLASSAAPASKVVMIFIESSIDVGFCVRLPPEHGLRHQRHSQARWSARSRVLSRNRGSVTCEDRFRWIAGFCSALRRSCSSRRPSGVREQLLQFQAEDSARIRSLRPRPSPPLPHQLQPLVLA